MKNHTCQNCGYVEPKPDPIATIAADLLKQCQNNGYQVSWQKDVVESTAALLLNRAEGTLRNWRSSNHRLLWDKRGGKIRYAIKDLALYVYEEC